MAPCCSRCAPTTRCRAWSRRWACRPSSAAVLVIGSGQRGHGHTRVDADNRGGAGEAVRYLVAQGCRHILRHLLAVLVMRPAHLTSPSGSPGPEPDATYLCFRDAVERDSRAPAGSRTTPKRSAIRPAPSPAPPSPPSASAPRRSSTAASSSKPSASWPTAISRQPASPAASGSPAPPTSANTSKAHGTEPDRLPRNGPRARPQMSRLHPRECHHRRCPLRVRVARSRRGGERAVLG